MPAHQVAPQNRQQCTSHTSPLRPFIFDFFLQETYVTHDEDNNGYFDKSEFADILEQIGKSYHAIGKSCERKDCENSLFLFGYLTV